MIELRSSSPQETHTIAGQLALLSRAGDLIVLAGEMGAGKTAFAQGFARALGVDEPVTSPTFTLVHRYDGDALTLHHADLYRLEHTDDVADLAFDELLDEPSIVLVEWGDVVDLGPHLHVHLAALANDDELREIVITSSDSRWSMRWERVEAALARWAA